MRSIGTAAERRTWRADPAGEAYQRMRQAVIAAAETAINESGISDLRVERVAELAGCTRQNVYRYFASKKQLVHAVLLRRSERLGRFLVEKLQTLSDPRERLLEGLLDAVELAALDPHLQSYFTGTSALEMVDFITASSDLTQLVNPLLDAVDHTESAAPAAGTTPRVRKDLDRGELSEWLFRVFLTEMIWRRAGRGDREQRKQYLRKLLLPSVFERTPTDEGPPR